MLLIEPTLSVDEWANAKDGDTESQQAFEQYCKSYEAAVLALPRNQLAKILAHLAEGFEAHDVGTETYRRILSRELHEEEFEPSSKVAKLVVACSLGHALTQHGYELDHHTSWLLMLCRMLIPVYLGFAIDDHYGQLPVAI